MKEYTKYYTLAELPKQTGVVFSTLASWVRQGFIKKALPVTYPGFKPEELHGSTETFYSEFEVERIKKAKAEADAIGSRSAMKFILLSLPDAKPGHAISPKRLAYIVHAGYELLKVAIENVTGLKRMANGSHLGIDEAAIPDIIAEVKRLKIEINHKRAEKVSTTCKKRNEMLTRIIGDNSGIVKIHLNGMAIELQKADAEALAEEIINQL